MRTLIVNACFAIACLTIACNNGTNQQTEEQQAWDAVMLVHDEVMPRMSEVNRMSDELRTKATALDSAQMDTKQSLMSAAHALERSDEGMMNWMAEVQALETLRGEGKTHDEIMRYLEEQKNKVNQVRDSIQLSLERGNQLLQQLPAATPDTTNQ